MQCVLPLTLQSATDLLFCHARDVVRFQWERSKIARTVRLSCDSTPTEVSHCDELHSSLIRCLPYLSGRWYRRRACDQSSRNILNRCCRRGKYSYRVLKLCVPVQCRNLWKCNNEQREFYFTKWLLSMFVNHAEMLDVTQNHFKSASSYVSSNLLSGIHVQLG